MTLSSRQCSDRHSRSDSELRGQGLPNPSSSPSLPDALDTPAFERSIAHPHRYSKPWLGLTLMLGNLVGFGALELAGPSQALAGGAVRESVTRTANTGLTGLTVDGARFSARYDGVELRGELDASKAIKSLRYGNVSYTPGNTLPIAQLESFMKRLDAVVSRAVSAEIGLTRGTGFALSSVDGFRFELSVARDGSEIRYVATPGGVARVDRIFTEENRAQLERSRADVEKESKSIAADLSAALGRDHGVELAARGRRAWAVDRAEAVEAKIKGYIEARRLHPVPRETWERYLESFDEKTRSHRDVLAKSPSAVGWPQFQGATAALEKQLVEFEKSLGISPPEQGYSPAQALFVLERLERSRAFNERLTAAETALSSNRELSAEARAARSAEIAAKRQSFDELFGRPYGWERWDVKSLGQEKHRAVMAKLDEWLTPMERELGITPATSDADVSKRFSERLARFEDAVSSRDELAAREHKRELVDLANGDRIIEQQDSAKKEAFDRYVDRGDRFERVWYEAGRRTWLSEGTRGSTETITGFSESGAVASVDEWSKADGAWRLDKQRKIRTDGTSTVSDARALTYEILTASGDPLGRIRYADDAKSIRELSMFDAAGKAFGNYPDEKARAPELTREKYLDLLARKLDTPQKIHVYLDLFMRYTSDDSRDVWQLATTTLDRVENRKMLGDCDDYAFLVRDILRRQGVKAEVLCIPTPPHALCVWVEKRSDGRYDAHSICTFGYDKNGNRHLHAPDAGKEKGYATALEAMQSLMVKFKQAGTGVEQGAVYTLNGSSLQILDLSPQGGKIWRWLSVGHFTSR